MPDLQTTCNKYKSTPKEVLKVVRVLSRPMPNVLLGMYGFVADRTCHVFLEKHACMRRTKLEEEDGGGGSPFPPLIFSCMGQKEGREW